MSIFQKISKLFSTTKSSPQAPKYEIVVKCKRCGEIVRTKVNLYNDLSLEYGQSEAQNTYVCRKMLMGEGHCFQQVEVELTFDTKRNLINREVTGGEFVEE